MGGVDGEGSEPDGLLGAAEREIGGEGDAGSAIVVADELADAEE